MPGFPIRTSSDPRSVDSSPRHIAASHVLHRLPVPRHPPCALKHLQHKTKKMSHPHTTPTKGTACEYQKNLHYMKQQPAQRNPPPQGRQAFIQAIISMLATTIHKSNTTPHHQSRATTAPSPTHPQRVSQGNAGLLSQSPIVCLAIPARLSHRNLKFVVLHQTRAHYRRQAIQRIDQITEPPHDVGGPDSRGAP